MTRVKLIVLFTAAAGALVLSSCGGPPDVEVPATFPVDAGATSTAVPPTPTPAPPSELIVCLAQVPDSLYLYADISPAADTVLQAIYDGPIDLLDYRYTPVVLEKLPSLSDGDARIEPTTIAAGDVHLNPITLEPEMLTFGRPYLPVGCRGSDCVQTYRGGRVEVERLVAEFRLREGLQWSDGTPLTAADSVLSYELDGAPETPTNKYLYARTRSYTALDDRRVEWVGIPGYLDVEFEANFWSPLPMHLLADLTAEQVLESEGANRMPLGWGPYSLVEWESGGDLRLARNPLYFRAEEGLPAFETLLFRFLGDQAGSAIDQLRTGECDLLDESLLSAAGLPELTALAQEGEFVLQVSSSAIVERLEFNLQPLGQAAGGAVLPDPTVRGAVRACINRAAIVEDLLAGSVQPGDSFLPVGHPDYQSAPDLVGFDAEAGAQALEQAGWKLGEDGVRTAQGVAGIPAGTRLAFAVHHLSDLLSSDVAARIAQDLSLCGIEVELVPMGAEELFGAYPDGPVFGRKFEAAVYAWPALVSPPCEMFASWEIPGDDNRFGINASGFQSDSYDHACRRILIGPSEGSDYQQAVVAVQVEFGNQIPGLPLYPRPRLVAHADWVCGFSLDPSNPSVMLNLERIHPCEG